jgi:hypothetical protein
MAVPDYMARTSAAQIAPANNSNFNGEFDD